MPYIAFNKELNDRVFVDGYSDPEICFIWYIDREECYALDDARVIEIIH